MPHHANQFALNLFLHFRVWYIVGCKRTKRRRRVYINSRSVLEAHQVKFPDTWGPMRPKSTLRILRIFTAYLLMSHQTSTELIVPRFLHGQTEKPGTDSFRAWDPTCLVFNSGYLLPYPTYFLGRLS